MEREKFSSRLGFILISAGCAIGLGNVWRFPYIVGKYGGAAFVLIYLAFLLVLGLPIVVMEFAVGRASKKSAALSFDLLEPKGSKWHLTKYIAMAGNYMLMMFYTTVAGWMLLYFFKMLRGDFNGLDSAGTAEEFSKMLADPVIMTVFMVVIVLVCFTICAQGLVSGVERITKIMMLLLFLLMVVLAVHSVLLEGGAPGLEFYLKPDFGKMKEAGLGEAIFAAMGQSFFTLSIGIGALAIFGSYIGKEKRLTGEAISITLLDTSVAFFAAMGQSFFTLSIGIGALAIFGSYIGKEKRLTGEAISITLLDTSVAFMSGLIIFPACFAYGIEPTSGPSLIFITLPNVFNHMAGGQLWGALFFVFMTFAALSTVIAVFQNIISFATDLTGCSVKKAVFWNVIVIILLSMPCVLGFNVLSGIQPLGPGTTIQDLEDFIVSNNLLPIGSVLYLLFCTSRYGWGFKNFVNEANEGEGIAFPTWARVYVSYILPLIVLFILIEGYIG